jgi:hypothetical protein
MDSRTNLDSVAKRKIPAPAEYRTSVIRPVTSTLLTELFRLFYVLFVDYELFYKVCLRYFVF